jgi:DnaJ like chaperone protein
MAAADGRISEEEEEVIKRFIGEYLVMTDQEEARALTIFRDAYKDETDFEKAAKSFYSSFKRRPVMLDMLFDMLLQISVADGEVSEEEDLLLQTAAKQFRFEGSRYEHLKSLHLAAGSAVTEDIYYLRLGVSPDAPDAEIIERYQGLAKLYDSDAVLDSGVPEVFINVAGKKLDDIEEAYSMIKLRRGIEEQGQD